MLRAGERTDTELHGYNLKGEEKWLRMRSLPVYDPLSGELSGNIGAATDITEAKRADLALRQSQSVLQTIAEGSAAQLSLFDTEGRCLFVNRALAGRNPAQMTGGLIEDVVDPGRRASARQIFDKVIDTGIGVDLERAVINPETGEQREIELRLRPVLAIGKAVAVVLNVTDVTDIRRQQEDLRLQARIIATLREGVLVADANGRICLTNSAFDRMFGYQSGELVGRFAGDLSTLSPPAYEKVRQRIIEQLRRGDFEPTEFEALRKDGTRFIASCAFARIDAASEGRVVVVLSDVTGHKQLEREILQIANREQQRIGSDLHDGLGQDLTGVALLLRGFAARLKRAADPALRAALEPDVEQIIALVNDAIDDTRSLARGLSPVTAQRDGLVMGLEALASQTRERYGVVVTLEQDVGQFGEDHPLIDDSTNTHLYRIAQEAVVNAVRHGKPSRITIRFSATHRRIDLAIEDDGSGFAARNPPPASHAGGMGLKIMRYRARMIAAELDIDSVPGGGTTVHCRWGAGGT
jgi:PAS domain S-box-containing protein